jgi:hypothetical protein
LCGYELHGLCGETPKGCVVVVFGHALEFPAKTLNQNVACDDREFHVRRGRLTASRNDENRAQFVSSPNAENLPGGDDARMRDHSSTLACAKASISLGLAVGSKCRSESQMNLEAGSADVPKGKNN